jgi:hypothetical protein
MNVEGKSGPPRNEVSWQPILCTRGSGARPGKYDRTVFGTELYSDDMVCYGRHQIEGVADESKLPQWARMETEAEKPNQKQSILGELDALIKEAAELAERKGGANTKKRGDLEVD